MRQEPLTGAEDVPGDVLAGLLSELADADPLHRIELLQDIRRLMDEDLLASVVAAHATGASWSAIGRAAGISRQAAHERWRAVIAEAPAETSGDQDPGGDADAPATGTTAGGSAAGHSDASDDDPARRDSATVDAPRAAPQAREPVTRQRRELLQISVGPVRLPLAIDVIRTSLPVPKSHSGRDTARARNAA